MRPVGLSRPEQVQELVLAQRVPVLVLVLVLVQVPVLALMLIALFHNVSVHYYADLAALHRDWGQAKR